MKLSTLLSNLCSRVPGEDLTDKQILSIKSDLGSARNAAQNMALGVAAVGNLLANVGAEGEVGQETSERLGWFLEEIGGGHLPVGGARTGPLGSHQPAEGAEAMSASITMLRQGIRAERDLTSYLWAILNEMRLQRQLPEWAERAIDGTSQQADEISAHRKQVDSILFELVPGLREDVERTDRENYLEWRAREREVKDALGGGHV
ncbi:TPA: hypothetical protein ACKSZC_006164 [Pseudomonas aeruginosa]|nr:hypothetical protein [Pseudomonas aeruginosa]HEK0941057.1 hypothetical protein [Pseudomonas aeruginosa]